MKKILIMVLGIMLLSGNVYASEGYVMWHDSADKAYSTDYDGMLKTSEAKTSKNGAIVGDGKGVLTIKNLTTYDLMFTNEWTLELDGTSTVNTIEMSQKDAITIKGSGILKVKSIGLSMTEMTSPKDANHKEIIDKYLSGNYSLGVSGDYIVITGLDVNPSKKTTTATTEDNETASMTLPVEVSNFELTTSSSTIEISTIGSTTTVNMEDEKKDAKINLPLYMAIGGLCAVVLIGTLILKLKKVIK